MVEGGKTMKAVSITCIITGWLCVFMAALTALEVVPQGMDFVGTVPGIPTDDLPTVIFWVGLSGLLMLTAIAFGVIADKR